ncbi:hypothetical protein B0H14DRAFT_2591725 [Mycena olivaceomarginata]|nr:hypothetical protein B0H14DRAFT_2591725 [Mycena olivaceomarginata]
MDTNELYTVIGGDSPGIFHKLPFLSSGNQAPILPIVIKCTSMNEASAILDFVFKPRAAEESQAKQKTKADEAATRTAELKAMCCQSSDPSVVVPIPSLHATQNIPDTTTNYSSLTCKYNIVNYTALTQVLRASQTAQYSVEIWFQVAWVKIPLKIVVMWSKTSTFRQEISVACLEHKLAQTPVVGLVYTKRSVFVFKYCTANQSANA